MVIFPTHKGQHLNFLLCEVYHDCNEDHHKTVGSIVQIAFWIVVAISISKEDSCKGASGEKEDKENPEEPATLLSIVGKPR